MKTTKPKSRSAPAGASKGRTRKAGGKRAAPGVTTDEVRAAAREYRGRGLALCRVRKGDKNPKDDGWTRHSAHPDRFGDGHQIGVLAGPLSAPPGHSLVLLDLDHPDAVERADEFLPPTGMADGRPSKPRSHRGYLVPNDTIPAEHHSACASARAVAEACGHPGPRITSFTVGGKEAFKLQGTGGQVVVPPAVHPSGERREWDGGAMGEPAVVDFADLWDACLGLAEAIGATLPASRRPKPAKQPEGSRKHRHQPAGAPDAPPAAPGHPAEADEADRLVLDDVAASADGDRYRLLVAGDFSPWDGDQSRAHQSLCNWVAARVGNDPPRVLRVLSLIPAVTSHEKWGRRDYWDRTVAKAVEAAGERRAAKVRPSDCTDLANARRLARDFGGELRYCDPHRAFYVYDPETGAWARDGGRRVEHRAKLTVDRMIADAARAVSLARRGGDENERKEAERQLAWAVSSGRDTRRVLGMVRLASSEPELAVAPDEFDADPWLLNCPNCAVDLTTGRRVAHAPSHLVTRCAATVYDPDAACPAWDACVSAILGGDPELIRWVQRYLGYSLSADVSLQLLPVFWGHGRNGKSTLIDTLSAVVGAGYWGKTAPDLMLARRGEAHPTEVADLHGLRLAFAVETDEGRRLNEARIKELTGDATLKARRMREDFWEFRRTNKLVLVTNHKPRVETGGEGMWRRLRLVPFAQRFWDEERGESGPPHLRMDKRLGARLLAERKGILAWLVRGCADAHADGLRLGPCGAIEAATREYEAGEDVFAQFVAETLELRPGDADAKVPAAEVRDRYQAWAADNRARPLTPRALTDKLKAVGVERYESHGKTVYRGVRLR